MRRVRLGPVNVLSVSLHFHFLLFTPLAHTHTRAHRTRECCLVSVTSSFEGQTTRTTVRYCARSGGWTASRGKGPMDGRTRKAAAAAPAPHAKTEAIVGVFVVAGRLSVVGRVPVESNGGRRDPDSGSERRAIWRLSVARDCDLKFCAPSRMGSDGKMVSPEPGGGGARTDGVPHSRPARQTPRPHSRYLNDQCFNRAR